MPPGFPGWLSGKESPANAEDTGDKGSIRRSGRSLEKGMTEDEIVRWHHQINGHEFE